MYLHIYLLFLPANPAAVRASPTATMELACRKKDNRKHEKKTQVKEIITCCKNVIQ